MVATNVEMMSVFQRMLASIPEFYQSLVPNGVDPNDRVRWLSTFDETLKDDILRPYALILNQPFGAMRNTEGDADVPLSESGFLLYLEREAEDFSESYTNPITGITHSGDQAKLVQFMEWFGAIQNSLEQWSDTSTDDFLRFRQSVVVLDVMRTPLAKRESDDDFFSVGIEFQIGQGGSS
jgi:hypothetical protein